MRQVAYIIIALCVFLACGGNRQQEDTLMRARAVMNAHPDSALAILDSLYRNEAEMGNHFRMQVLLHRTEAQNKLFTQFPSDSIQTELVDYFDRHGTRNERMLAHYLLGCVLSDLGDSPEALQAFYDAIEMADTTRTDCDLYTLRVVYGQMAMLYRRSRSSGHSSEVYVTQHFSCSDCKKSLPNLDYVHRKKRLTQKNWDDSHPSELTAKNRPNLLVINPL
jgi:hypothetical protein